MIRNSTTFYFLKDESKIENYEKAKIDKKTWVCHHRLETHFSNGDLRPIHCAITSEELKALNMYDFRPPEELIFLTVNQHIILHNKINDFKSKSKGRKVSEETKRKMSIAQKKRGALNSMFLGKKCKCIETDTVFISCMAASRWCNSPKVAEVCKGKRKTAGGYHWEYI
jgi:hypothetical protein